MRGPLHGIPIALKDIIQTKDLRTTGGALAFIDLVPPYDATVTTNLREAGAVIIAKTNLTELANWVAGPPTAMPANYNAVAGYGMNPYDPRRDPREATGDGRPALSTGGSSSGVGTAVSFWAANVGTETSGSILSPANQTMLAAIKPTVGRISRYGIIPITADQDTAGPMARTVSDAAILLGVLESAAPDPHDPATRRCTAPPDRDYTRSLQADGLRGARIGIPRAFFYDAVSPPDGKGPRGGLDDAQKQVMQQAIAALVAAGAVVVDPADIPSVTARGADDSFLSWSVCTTAKGKDADCSIGLQVRHEARLQRVARLAGRPSPREDADGTARVEHRPREDGRRSSTGSRCSISPTRWTSTPTGRATSRIARKTFGSRPSRVSTRRCARTTWMPCCSPAALARRSPRSLAIPP